MKNGIDTYETEMEKTQMKKLFALALVLMMVVSAVAAAEETVSVVGAWELCGGNTNGVEWEQADLENALAQYGGVLQFAFYEDGSAEMIQAAAVVPGAFTLETGSDYAMVATFVIGETELIYACLFTEVEGQIVMMLTPDGENFMYFIPVAA